MYGGNQSHSVPTRWVKTGCITTKGKHIRTFADAGIILSLDGSAGSMTYKKGDETFALNHHAGFLKPLLQSRTICNPEFFAIFFQNRLRATAVSDGSKTLSIQQLVQFTFSLPPLDIQHHLLQKYQLISARLKVYDDFATRIDDALDKQVSSEYLQYQAKEIPISELLDCMSGNTGLTEELIYSKSNFGGTRYQVLTASTIPDTAMGYIPKCTISTASGRTKELNTFEGKEGLLVVRKGKAGGTRYLPEGKYVINDDAYIVSVKNDCPYQIDLRWLAIACKTDFLAYASNSDNGTWNKTGFFNNVTYY
ncbi:MAG: restriction endonuclease subunit S [Bifidobacterium sp.]|uniref:restriction endonuclease subunit S n=1 Tax=Bifidobacterium sp. TaxID=41200 RepID=UPI0039E8216A